MMIRRLSASSVAQIRKFSLAVKFSATGQPRDVLKLGPNDPLPPLGAQDVALKFLAAPINPSDLNMAEGVYGVRPTLPAIGGNEGVAEVTAVGAEATGLSVGDWVIPAKAGFGTWRQHALAKSSDVVKVAKDIPVAYAATLAVNPSTAYRLLKDFVKLSPGDYIVQNGANSMVGLAVIQMARIWGFKTINIVRNDRPGVDKTLELLTNLGGDINVPDNYFGTYDFNEILAELPPVKLALNTVGGESATDLARALAPGGTLVTYGGMSRRPVSIPEDIVTSKGLHVKGFWMSKWNDLHSHEQRKAMLDEISGWIRDKQLSFFLELHDFDDFDYALSKATEPFYLRKVVLNLDYPDRFAEHDKIPDEDYEIFETPQDPV